MDRQRKGLLSYWNLHEFNPEVEPPIVYEYPIYSDADIYGQSVDPHSPYHFINLHNDNIRQLGGSWETLTLRILCYLGDERPDTTSLDTDTAHYHGGWFVDEVVSIASMLTGIRLEVGDCTRELYAENAPYGRPLPQYQPHRPIRYSQLGPVLRCVKHCRDLSVLGKLNKLKVLTVDQYIALVRAARMYSQALWIAESQPDFAWLLLISSVEIASNQWSEQDDSPEDRLKALRPEVADLLINSGGEDLLKAVATQISHSLGATNKFVKFCLNYIPEPPSVRPDTEKVKWTRKGFKEILNKLYKYRSDALHGGTPFPMPLCMPATRTLSPDLFAEVPLGLASHGWGATWNRKDLPINLDTFCLFITGVLNNWVDDLINQNEPQ